MYLICGLGNPGKKYINTRHNLGFLLIDKLLENYKFKLIKSNDKSDLYKGSIGDYTCILLKPMTYMNLSGSSVLEVMNFYKIKKSKLYVLHDDIDLKIGKIKIKIGGGNGGHNGLKSIDASIGKDYLRLRIGIGHPGNKNLVSNYVLKKFSKDEEEIIENKLNIINKYFNIIFLNKSLFLTRIAEEKL